MTSDMVGLKEIADELRAMREQFQRMDEGADTVLTYIQYADLQSCKAIVDELVERVSTLVGCASELEDASCALQFEIERIENPCQPPDVWLNRCR